MSTVTKRDNNFHLEYVCTLIKEYTLIPDSYSCRVLLRSDIITLIAQAEWLTVEDARHTIDEIDQLSQICQWSVEDIRRRITNTYGAN